MRTKKQINIEIGERIKLAREKNNITQEKLAEMIDVSTQYISDLERGVVGAALATIKSICIALGVSSDSLLFGEKNGNEMPCLNSLCYKLNEKQIEALSEIIKIYAKAVSES